MPVIDSTTSSPSALAAGDRLSEEMAGLDALEIELDQKASRWSVVWPKLAAVAVFLAFWQVVVWSHWRPEYLLPGPKVVIPRFFEEMRKAVMWRAIGNTMRRAITGFTFSVIVGTIIGIAVSQSRVLRSAIGSMLTGLQTMPSIAWFPLALLLFRLSEGAIFFVVVIGAAPSIANGLIGGIDHVPPLLVRAGRSMGARGLSAYRHVIIPAAMPAFVTGLKQGWAFSWRSLMAGELIVVLANRPSLGARLQFARELSDTDGLLALMIAVLLIGILVDVACFSLIERRLRRRRGLGS